MTPDLRRAAIVLALAFAFAPSAVPAATVECVSRYTAAHPLADAAYRDKLGIKELPRRACQSAAILGDIRPGDFERLRQLVVENHPVLTELRLNSTGGSTAEAVRIGRLARRALLVTAAPTAHPTERGKGLLTRSSEGPTAEGQHLCLWTDCVCGAACFHAWAGGAQREGNGLAVSRRALDSVAVGAIGRYLDEMEAAPAATLVARAPAADVHYLDAKLVEERLGGFAPSVAKTVNARCGKGLTPVERREMTLIAQGLPAEGSAERRRLDELLRRFSERRRCEWEALVRLRLANGAPKAEDIAPAPAALTRLDTAELQTRLKQAGYYDGPVDGIAGPLTAAAIKRFQTEANVAATGEWDGALEAALDRKAAQGRGN